MERISTGIPGLDDMVAGGLPAGSSVLLSGSCGTGKSMLSLQYIYMGAMNGEPGLYVSFEESKEKIIEHSRVFGWDIPDLEEKGMMEIFNVETEDIIEVLELLKKRVEEMGAKRVVLDSLTTMMEYGVVYRSQITKQMGQLFTKKSSINMPMEGTEVTRKDVYYIIREINKMGATSILISEVAEKSDYLSRDTISEFAVDGVILLEISTVGGSPERLVTVKKMRGTPIDLRMALMEFTNLGIEVKV